LKKKAIIFLFVCCFGSTFLKAQFYSLPNDYHFAVLTESVLAGKDSSIHSAVKPYIPFFSNKYNHVADTHIIFKYISEDPALDLAFYKPLINVNRKEEKFKLNISPILNYQSGRDLVDSTKEKLVNNTRGVIASVSIGSDLYIETLFAENQTFFPNYLRDYSKSTGVVPGQGRHKVFKVTGFDYAFACGLVSYQVNKHLNIQVGHGKQKIGHGYRSLLLSDNAFNYPYARFTQQWLKGKLQYTNIYAVLMNLTPALKVPVKNAEPLFQKKPAAFQYLSYNVSKWLNLGLFQGIIWQVADEQNRQQLNWMYANPLIFTHAGAFGLNSKNNVLLGADMKVKFTDRINVYAQVMADDLSSGKSLGKAWGYQLGANWFNALGIKNFMLQGEFNQLTESSYLSPLGTLTNQSYSHYNQNLAFTPGSGRELLLVADFKKKRVLANLRYHNQNIVKNTDNFYNTSITNASIGYLINPAYNLNISIGYTYRYQKFYNFKTPNLTTSFLNLTIKTNLYNTYYDF
jgi:hypothetical protein